MTFLFATLTAAQKKRLLWILFMNTQGYHDDIVTFAVWDCLKFVKISVASLNISENQAMWHFFH